ncbi:MAG: family ATPase [Proteiniphilum sp.]|jgi:predicted AAA+ superfamily ATPase|nr:family ATPase [Proteiniphilum sp.]
MDSFIEKYHHRLTLTDTAFIRSLADRIIWNSRLIGIKGARGVGKTTLMLQYLKQNYGHSDAALYVSLDNIWFADHRLTELTDNFVKHGGKHLFLDEVHKYPSWSQEIKNIYDDYPDLQIVFTGSSLLEILNARADLSRRADIYPMQGLSFREYMAMYHGISLPSYSLEDILEHHTEISVDVMSLCKPLQFFADYLQHGYYPYYGESPQRYPIRLEETVNMILEIELPLLRGVEHAYIHKLKQLMQIISQSAPFIPNISKLAERTGVSRSTLTSYLKYLEETALLISLYKESGGMTVLQKPEKIYLENSNLMFVLGIDRVNTGNLRETFFANQLSFEHTLKYSPKADFLVDDKYTFEIGGKNKPKRQIHETENAFIASDDIEFGAFNRIPLWMFGLMY